MLMEHQKCQNFGEEIQKSSFLILASILQLTIELPQEVQTESKQARHK